MLPSVVQDMALDSWMTDKYWIRKVMEGSVCALIWSTILYWYL